jgi:tetratricopeptide (TPR) repeat protein
MANPAPRTTLLRRLLIAALLAPILVYHIHWSGNQFMADLKARAPIQQMDHWQTGAAPTAQQWRAALEQLASALAHMPDNTTVLSNMGRLHNIALDDASLDEQAHGEAGEQAIDYYQQALALRPTWPWDWGNLTILKYRLLLYEDGSYADAFRTTARLGLRRADVALLLTELGLDTWSILDEEARTVLAAIIDTESQRQPDQLNAILERYPRWTRVCPYLETPYLVTPCLELE